MSKTLFSLTVGLATFAVTLNPKIALLAFQGAQVASSITSALFANSPPPPSTTTAIKTERPEAVAAYGRRKLYGGATLCYETSASGVAVDVWAFHDGRIDAIEGWYLGDKPVTRLPNGFVQGEDDGLYGDGNVIQIGANLGAAVEMAHAPVIAALPGRWTADHRGDGVVTGYMISKPVKTKNYQKTYPAGGPNQTPLGLVMRATPVFDWRDPAQLATDPRTWKWSENSWLHIAHYILVREAVGPSRPPSDPAYWADVAGLLAPRWARLFVPSLGFWTAAANDADVAVPLKTGGTEPRYRSCVSHKLAGEGSEHKAVKASLLATCDGWLASRRDGAIIARAGRYYTPTVSIGPDQIVSYTVEEGVEDENALNSINVSYVSSLHDFNVVDTDPWVDEDDIVERGAVRSLDLSAQTPSHSQNRRLAKRKMSQVRKSTKNQHLRPLMGPFCCSTATHNTRQKTPTNTKT